MPKPPAFYTASLAIGDCLCATPTIRKISEVYEQKVRAFSHFPEVFRNLPYVSSSDDFKDYVLEINDLSRDYDMHKSFWHLGKKVAMSDPRGVEFKHPQIDIRQYHAIDNGFMLTNEELSCDFYPMEEMKFYLPEKYVVLHPFKNWESRTWSEQNWKTLIEKLNEWKIPVVIVGKDNIIDDRILKHLREEVVTETSQEVFSEMENKKSVEIQHAGVINLSNQTNLSQAWHVLNRAFAVITMDSGILHLAGTTDTHIVQLGSSINPYFRAPYRRGRQDYKYIYVKGSCNLFCASNLKYSLKEWEFGYSGGTPIQNLPPLDKCLEKKPTYECHPSPEQVFNVISTLWVGDREPQKILERSRETNNKILIKIQSESLGDTIGALAVIESFRIQTGKKVEVISKIGEEMFGMSYPEIRFHSHATEPVFNAKDGTYSIGDSKYDDFKRIFYIFDKPLIKGYADQLDVKSWDRPLIDSYADDERPIKNKYVCFSMHSTAQSKFWNYPDGWDKLSRMLRKEGITPVCIDRFDSFGTEGHWNPIPPSCVKKQGMNLEEMTHYLHHAEFFIGISSGLSWVAHAMGKKVVMISGVTSEDNEFEEDTVRIINREVCHGCINDSNISFNAGDWMWCPHHKGTNRQFECTTTITPEKVMEEIKNHKLI
jgi:autotransporter strand-loop-strand O-heptosyltransferase